jgi:sulfopyruvate decarboxylase TPP-binding subunit
MTGEPLFRPVSAAAMQQVIHDLGITHVLSVPDTHQRVLLDLLATDDALQLLTVSTEDEAMGIAAGLYAGGAQPLLIIQHAGLFAGMNSLRGIAQDYRIPTLMLVGMFEHDPYQPIEQSHRSAARLAEPVMAAMGVPCWRLNGPEDLDVIRAAYDRARADRGPAVVFVMAAPARE